MSFEQEMDEDAEYQGDYRALRARNEESIHSIPVVLHGEGRAQPLSAPEIVHSFFPRTTPLPIGVGGSTSMPSGINPLQSETHSNIHSNYAAVEDVAKPAVQPAAETVSSNYLYVAPQAGHM